MAQDSDRRDMPVRQSHTILSAMETNNDIGNNRWLLSQIQNDEKRDSDNTFDSESTVIHHHHNKVNNEKIHHRHSLDLDLDLEEYALDTDNLDGSTQTSISSISDLMDLYVENYIQYKNGIYNQMHSILEEFKFDIFTNHLTMNSHFQENENNDLKDHEGREGFYFRISETPYMVLIHSIRPKLISLLILSHLRRRVKNGNTNERSLKSLIKLLTLAISILNMSNNTQLSLIVYTNALMNRTRQILSSFAQLERFILFQDIHNIARNRIRNRNRMRIKNMKMKQKLGLRMNNDGLITSMLHTLILLTVKKIRKVLSYGGVNMESLWQYLVIYGLNGEDEEGKIVRNVMNSSGSSCNCTWSNEPQRLLRALQYVKKVLLCIVLSVMECGNDHNDHNEDSEVRESALLFMKKFWRKFGFTYDDYNRFCKWGSLKKATRLLGISQTLVELDGIVNQLHEETFQNEDVEFGDGDEEEAFELETNVEYDNSGLEMVSERNEDDRVRELSALVETLACKIDLIELGVNTGDDEIKRLREDVNNLTRYYDNITSIANKERRSGGGGFELKKLRMSEILLDDYDYEEEKEKEKEGGIREGRKGDRRSSGLAIKLLNLVKEEEEEEEDDDGDDIIEDEHTEPDSVFKETLEKLCLQSGSRSASEKEVAPESETEKESGSPKDEEGYKAFQRELRARLAGELARELAAE